MRPWKPSFRHINGMKDIDLSSVFQVTEGVCRVAVKWTSFPSVWPVPLCSPFWSLSCFSLRLFYVLHLEENKLHISGTPVFVCPWTESNTSRGEDANAKENQKSWIKKAHWHCNIQNARMIQDHQPLERNHIADIPIQSENCSVASFICKV